MRFGLKKVIAAIICSGMMVFSARAEEPKSIDTSWFRDGAHHWRRIRDEKRVIQVLPNQPSYEPHQTQEIAANILLFQRANGGWPKDYDMTAVLTDEQRAQVLATQMRDDTSFDNHNVFPQVEYLAQAFVATGESELRDACLRGIDFMLAAQYSNGGIPQSFPKASSYHAHITFNDGVMIGVLRVLHDAAENRTHFAWLDSERREKAGDAVRRGVDCILKCQIRIDGQLTGWCQQHDRETYAPESARTFELASICPQDTTEIVEFLMSQKPATPEIVDSVDAAVKWLESVKLSGIRIERVKAPPEEFLRHTADFDVVAVQDPAAPSIWARHYEIGTNQPIFAGRDAVKKYSLAEIERERRTGTPWYGSWPNRLLKRDYPAWRGKIDAASP